MVERRFANRFPKSEEAHAFEMHVRSAALDAGLSVGPGGVADRGRRGSEVRLTLSGDATALDRFAATLQDGTRLEAAE